MRKNFLVNLLSPGIFRYFFDMAPFCIRMERSLIIEIGFCFVKFYYKVLSLRKISTFEKKSFLEKNFKSKKNLVFPKAGKKFRCVSQKVGANYKCR